MGKSVLTNRDIRQSIGGFLAPHSGLRVLIVDHNEERQLMYREILEERGHRVHIYSEASPAFKEFKKEFFPFVIIDSSLPDEDGVDLCMRIRSLDEGSRCVILMVTGREHLHDLQSVLDAGTDDYIAKPVDVVKLKARIIIAERRIREIMEGTIAAENLRRLSLVAKRTDNLVIITDPHGRIEWVNVGFERVTGYKENEVLGKRPGDFLQGTDTDPDTIKFMSERLKNGQGFDVEIVNYSKSGRKYWLAIEVRPVHDENGNITNFMAIESDITALKNAQEEIARARAQEVEIGSRIQRALLFGRPPEGIEGAKLGVLAMASSKIDGDFYDVHTHTSRLFDVLVGDVMGKGVPAALVGAATKSEFLRATTRLLSAYRSEKIPTPEEIVNAVHKGMTAELEILESFVTAAYARFDLDRKQMYFVNCGHSGIIHCPSKSDKCESFQGINLPFGVSKDEVYRQKCIPIDHGDIFVFYSDGLTEARNQEGELLGESRLIDFIIKNRDKTPQELTESLREMAIAFSGFGGILDDLTCITVKID